MTTTHQRRFGPNTIILLISVLVTALLLGVLAVFIMTQFGPKTDPQFNLDSYNPPLNSYPDSTLIASDSNTTGLVKQVWRLYVSKDELSKIKQYYQDQFLSFGYKQATDLLTFPLEFYKEQNTRCFYVRYGLDASGLDENKLELPGLSSDDLKKRYPSQSIFVVQELDTAIKDASC